MRKASATEIALGASARREAPIGKHGYIVTRTMLSRRNELQDVTELVTETGYYMLKTRRTLRLKASRLNLFYQGGG